MRHSFLYAALYFGEIGVCSICCRKLVIAQKYLAEVWPNFGTRSAPSAETSASAEHYKGMFGAPLAGSFLSSRSPGFLPMKPDP